VNWLAARRGFILIFSLLFCALRFGWERLVCLYRGVPLSTRYRAEWMHFCGATVLSAMGIRYRVEGSLPQGTTMIVANHLSYLDIAICSAAMPCAFVAKEEIAGWPFFGWLAQLGGTIFLDRESRLSAWDATESIALRLAEDVPVLFFPEGTSTDGSEILRFHSTLFEPAIQGRIPITPAAVFYQTPGDTAERDLCWFGDESFVPHLLRVLRVTGFTAVIRFGTPEILPDRRTAAWRNHDAVEALRQKTVGRHATVAVQARVSARSRDFNSQHQRAG